MPARTPESPASSTVSEAELIAAAEPDTACWFDDGNLVIVAGGSKFLAYGGHIARLSPVFKNMFSFPQSPSPECPAVVLRDEPAVIRRFLATILYTQTSPSLILDFDYETVSALIHVGHKYQIDSILRDGIEFLKAHFPIDFQTWLSSRYRTDQKRTWPSSPHVPPRFELIHAIGVMKLAHLTETSSILPTALLACTLLSPSEIVNGFTDADGALIVLSAQDQDLVSKGKDKLSQAVTAAICWVFKCMDNPGQCWVRDTCAPAAHVVLSQLLESEQLNVNPDPFQRWEDYRKFFLSTKTHAMCDDCREWRAKLFDNELRKLWAGLPKVFEVQVQEWQF